MHHSIYNIYHSRVLSIPLLGTLFYRIQIFFIEGEIIHHCWVSRKNNIYREQLLQTVQSKASTLICSAWELGRQLSPLQGSFVFDYSSRHPKHLSLADLYCVEWALILATSVTVRSIKRLGNLLPTGFPIWSPYFISVHQPLDVQCDFIWQTIQQLLLKGSSVTIVSHVPQPQSVYERISQQPQITFVSSLLPFWISHLPYSLRKFFSGFSKRMVKQQLQELSGNISHPVLWCFDPDDVKTLQFKPPRTTVIYDCVDFYSSTDPLFQKRILKDQKKLLESAQLMFVNSHSLLKAHQKHRSDIVLVPQGFDVDTFSSMKRTLPSDGVKKLMARLQKERRKYKGVVSYVGMMSHRVDYPLLLKLVKSNPKVLFCLPLTRLAWPTEDAAKLTDNQHLEQEKLHSQKNILWFPSLTRSDVMILLRKSTVGLIPYDDRLPFNKYCFPMKFFEYMSVGIPTISTEILELKYYKPFAQTGKNYTELNKLLKRSLRRKFNSSELIEMQKLCRDHSWNNKVEQIITTVSDFQRRSFRFAA